MATAHRRKLRRVVTCQGSIQLAAALATLRQREDEQRGRGLEYEDYLVIYDLSPPEQVEEFAALIKKMALLIGKWKEIVHITPERLGLLAAALGMNTPANVFSQVYGLVGTDAADEIYLCRNWQFCNHLFINAYCAAEKICYGDGIGLYFSESYFYPNAAKAVNESSEARPRFSVKNKLRGLARRLKAAAKRLVGDGRAAPPVEEGLREVEFDVGYFLLPDILGQRPPMKTVVTEKHHLLHIFQKLGDTLDADYTREMRNLISNRPAVVLMTANFSEAERMTLENEIAAYREFLRALNYPRESKLLIKPHPRDHGEKIQKIKSATSELFSETILLTEADLFFIPFEVFLIQTLMDENMRAPQNLRIITFSSACLSLELLFKAKPLVGFGPDLVKKMFHEDYVEARLGQERDLNLAIQRISSKS